MLDVGFDAVDVQHGVDDGLQRGPVAGDLRLLVGLDVQLQRHPQAGHFLPRHLVRAADGVIRAVIGDRGVDQVGPAEQQAGRLRAADVLAPAHRDQVRAVGDESAQVGLRRQHGRGVHDHRHAVTVGDLHCLGQGRPATAHSRRTEVRDRRGALRDRVLDLLRAPCRRVTDLPELRAREGVHVAVPTAVRLRDDDLVLHAPGVREPKDLRPVRAGQAGGR